MDRPGVNDDFLVVVPKVGAIRLLPREQWSAFVASAGTLGFKEKGVAYVRPVAPPLQIGSIGGRVFFARELSPTDNQDIQDLVIGQPRAL